MKKMYLKILAIVIAVVMLSAGSVYDFSGTTDMTADATSRTVLSSIVWSDNFDDEDISDWQLFKVNHSASPDTLMPGNSTAVGGVLRHLETEWSYAGHNSSVTFGTWTFDVDIQEPVNEYHFSIAFLSEPFDDDWLTYGVVGSAYGINFYIHDTGTTEIRISKADHDTGVVHMDSYTEANMIGWRSIIITRELSGQFYVYLTGTLILKAKDLQHTTSERFYFLSHGGPAIDNVTVSDTIDYDAAPPEWDQLPADQIIDAGVDFYYDLNATDYSGVDQWWISNTQYFTINDGVISNIDALEAGSYVIEVNVNDTNGYTQTDEFTLTVRELPPTIPMELVVGAAGAAAFIIIVLVIWRKKG